ncbi:hypothetical protein MTO96_013127 [Rhipicephalus appendiculatus]
MFSRESGDSTPKQMSTTSVLRPQPVIVPVLLGGHLRCSVRGSLRRSFLFPAVMVGTLEQGGPLLWPPRLRAVLQGVGRLGAEADEDDLGAAAATGHSPCSVWWSSAL